MRDRGADCYSWSDERIVHFARAVNVDATPLFTAAGIARGSFKLTADVSEAGRNVGGRLVARWSALTDEQYAAIDAVLKGE